MMENTKMIITMGMITMFVYSFSQTSLMATPIIFYFYFCSITCFGVPALITCKQQLNNLPIFIFIQGYVFTKSKTCFSKFQITAKFKTFDQIKWIKKCLQTNFPKKYFDQVYHFNQISWFLVNIIRLTGSQV